MNREPEKTAQGEHILVCLSSSPSNPKVIEEAARLAASFHAPLTALYVQTSSSGSMSEEDRLRLQENTQFAEDAGASVVTIAGDDVPQQIAEYSRLSDITKIVIGRSGGKQRRLFAKPSLTEELIQAVPDADVCIIPDSAAALKDRRRALRLADWILPSKRDLLITPLLLLAATGIGLLFTRFGFSEANIITVYILGVLVTARLTHGLLASAVSSLASVFLFNFFFIEPRFSFHTYEAEYAVTFAVMLAASLITGTLANRLKENARRSDIAAFREKVLFDTNQLLQKAASPEEVLRITAGQLTTLLDRPVSILPETEDVPTDTAESIYRTISLNGHSYGTLCISLSGRPLEAFESGVLQSIIGECALALDSLRNAAERERAALMAQDEQLRADLLRTISHDIRTPLTSISGNASNLLSHYDQLDEQARTQIFTDMVDDSQWLIELVENALSISRIGDGRTRLHLSLELISDVVTEALAHISRRKSHYSVLCEPSDELLLARMDPKLITQVLINLINNAIDHTQEGAEIRLAWEKRDGMAAISVCDNGPGIPDAEKPHVFEMFYTGPGQVADGKRGLGLGLALCRSIVEAHGGTISLTDNVPSGCRFTFTLPTEEVTLHE